MKRTVLLSVVVLLGVTGVDIIGQIPQAPPAAISGIVVDGGTKVPIAGALVVILTFQRGAPVRRQFTDGAGRFVFAELAAAQGSVVLRASKSGYLAPGADYSPSVSDRRITLRSGEWVADVQLPLWRTAGIDGAVFDESGEPIVDVWVRLFAKIRVIGKDYLAVRGLTKTEDRGRYRFVGLAPGDYLVQVPSPARSGPQTAGARGDGSVPLLVPHFPMPPPVTDASTFTYSSTFSQSATLIGGEQRGGVDVRLMPVPAFQVSGIVAGPPESWRDLTLRLLSQDAASAGLESESASTLVGDNGRFAFLNVPAGAYVLDASRVTSEFRADTTVPATFRNAEFSKPAAGPSLGGVSRDVETGPAGVQFATSTVAGTLPDFWARQPLVVGADAKNIVVTMRQTGVMRGRIVKDLARGVVAPQFEPGAGIELEAADGSPALGVLRSRSAQDTANGRFMIQGLLPGEYVLRVQNGWNVKSISWNGSDYSDAPFDAAKTQDFDDVEVIVTNGGTTLSGRVLDDRGAAVRDAFVMVFPAAPRLWTNFGFWPPKIRSVVTSQTGEYEFTGLPAGDYRVIAIDGGAADLRPDPDLMKAADPLATHLSLSWNQPATVDLVVHHGVR